MIHVSSSLEELQRSVIALPLQSAILNGSIISLPPKFTVESDVEKDVLSWEGSRLGEDL